MIIATVPSNRAKILPSRTAAKKMCVGRKLERRR
jgi:hypothetical protein